MDGLKNIATNVPTWLTRLDDLSGQIDKRQVELAELAELAEQQATQKSLRNKGSTESLKPKDDADYHAMAPTDLPHDEKNKIKYAGGGRCGEPLTGSNHPPSSPISDPKTPAALHKHSHQVLAVAHARARAMVQRKVKTASMMSSADAPKYRTRTMVIIYYDSYVQSFFEELVKFVSASRNLLRKAKVAARVAQIRKLADIDMGGVEKTKECSDASNSGAPLLAADPATDGPNEPLPPLRYMSSRRMGPILRTAGMGGQNAHVRGIRLASRDDKADVCDELEKVLEGVQTMAEHGAHQFLRDGTCHAEIANIQERLTEARELALKEMERVEHEEPEAIQAQSRAEDMMKPRARKAPGMRKITKHDDNQSAPAAAAAPASPAAAPTPLASQELEPSSSKEPTLEVDDESNDAEKSEPPQLLFRSAMGMRARRAPWRRVCADGPWYVSPTLTWCIETYVCFTFSYDLRPSQPTQTNHCVVGVPVKWRLLAL